MKQTSPPNKSAVGLQVHKKFVGEEFVYFSAKFAS